MTAMTAHDSHDRPMNTAMDTVEAIFEFFARISVGQATRSSDISPGVTVVFNDDFPVSHVQNSVNATPGATSDGVLAGLDLLVGEGRHPYVNFWWDDDAAFADEMEPALVERGLKRENNELLLFNPGREQSTRPTTMVEVVSGIDLDPVVRAGWLRDLPDASDETISQLVDRRIAMESVVDTTYLAVRIDGVPVSRATLYRATTGTRHIGQVEDVNTSDEYRGRGYAGACVTRGVEILQEAGCDLIFLESDADDWPRELYFRLGFTHLAPLPVFTGPE